MKSRILWRLALLAGAVCCSIAPLRADAITFGLLPSDGNISGPPGSLIGWGYSLTNDSTSDWFMSTNLNADSFSNGTPTSLFDFPILSPEQTVTEPFDPINSIGIYELAWDPSAPIGFVNSGDFVLSGQWWDGNPLSGGTFIADAPDVSLPYTATVGGTSITPEPSSFFVLAFATGILLPLASRRDRRTHRAGEAGKP
jgi:hypothetical protein